MSEHARMVQDFETSESHAHDPEGRLPHGSGIVIALIASIPILLFVGGFIWRVVV
ncbi:hypothetical protein [Oceaniglobus ichthyenteri]|uniref:hypothetical protein n=1 Tax=Oceaniglobus ichthyenteri TaxID=2136177 RepID=UPI0013DD9C7A|nr:hypothetical protein [Oceaniglobus ichthyenteri]